MLFGDLYDGILRVRETERVISPIILTQIGEFAIQIYANSPLQFNIYTNDWIQAKGGPELQFWEKSSGDKKTFVISAQIKNQDGSTVPTKREFRLDEDVTQLTEEFPGEPQIGEIVKAFLLYEADRKG